MSHVPSFDDVTVPQLRESGGLEWSGGPDAMRALIPGMDFGTAPAVVAALHEAVDAGVFGYLPAAWETALAQAWGGWASDRYSWAVPVERVRPIADVMAGLQATIELFSAPGTPVILPTPAYRPFLIAPPEVGRQ